MFSSFGWMQGKIDQALVGLWHRNVMEGGATPGLGNLGAEVDRYYLFQADGTVIYTSNARIFGTVRGPGGTVGVDDRNQDPSTQRGTWSCADGKLVILWQGGGAAQFDYSVFPHQQTQGLKLTAPGQTKPIYYVLR